MKIRSLKYTQKSKKDNTFNSYVRGYFEHETLPASFIAEVANYIAKGDLARLKIINVIRPKVNTILENWSLQVFAYRKPIQHLIDAIQFKKIEIFKYPNFEAIYPYYDKIFPTIPVFLSQVRIKAGLKPNLELIQNSFRKFIKFRLTSFNQAKSFIESQGQFFHRKFGKNQRVHVEVPAEQKEDNKDEYQSDFAAQLLLMRYVNKCFNVKTKQRIGIARIEGNRISACINIEDFIGYQTTVMDLKPQWEQIFMTVYRLSINDEPERLRNNFHTRNIENKYSPEQLAARSNTIYALQNRAILDVSCLGCTPFFYENVVINSQSSNNLGIEIFSYASHFQRDQLSIRSVICAFLNDNGGVILFDCKRKGFFILPVGEIFTEKFKKRIIDKVMYLLEGIKPHSKEITKDVTISFVPVAKNPIHFPQAKDKEFLSGLFVLRITIKPSIINCLYYVESRDNKNLRFFYVRAENPSQDRDLKMMYYRQNGPIKTLRGMEIYVRMKAKIEKDLQRRAKLDEKSRDLPLKIYEHDMCLKPYVGCNKITLAQKTSNFEKYQYVSFLKIASETVDEEAVNSIFKGLEVKLDWKDNKQRKYFQAFSKVTKLCLLFHNARYEAVDNLLDLAGNKDQAGRQVLMSKTTDIIEIKFKGKPREVINHFINQLERRIVYLKTQKPFFSRYMLEKVTVWTHQVSSFEPPRIYLSVEPKHSILELYFILLTDNICRELQFITKDVIDPLLACKEIFHQVSVIIPEKEVSHYGWDTRENCHRKIKTSPQQDYKPLDPKKVSRIKIEN